MKEVEIFNALANPVRLKIVECLKDKERCVCEIIPYTGKSQPNVSQHIKVLKNAGIVEEYRKGTKVMIKISNKKIFSILDEARKLSK